MNNATLSNKIHDCRIEYAALLKERNALEVVLTKDTNRRKALLSAVDSAKTLVDERTTLLKGLIASKARANNNLPIALSVDDAAIKTASLMLDDAKHALMVASNRASVLVSSKCMSASERFNLQSQIAALNGDMLAHINTIDTCKALILAGEITDSIDGIDKMNRKKRDKAQRKEIKKQEKYKRNLERRLAKQTVYIPAGNVHTPNIYKPDIYALHGARVMQGTHNSTV